MTFFPVLSLGEDSREYGLLHSRSTVLFKTSEAVGARQPERRLCLASTKVQDVKGPVPAGYCQHDAGCRRRQSKEARQEARVVVIGDSTFASNQYFGQQRNGDLFLNA
jgi:hypothetical protein